jgi:MFS transporter, DHA1 family, multidrug resistance protein
MASLPLWRRSRRPFGDASPTSMAAKLILLRSSLGIGVFTAFMGMAATVWQFFAFRALMGLFAGFSIAAIALVASQVPEGRLGYALGWLSTGQLVGSLIGPLTGGVLADPTSSYRIPFYCNSATILLSMGLVWFAVDERFVAPPKSSNGRSTISDLIAVAA